MSEVQYCALHGKIYDLVHFENKGCANYAMSVDDIEKAVIPQGDTLMGTVTNRGDKK